MRFPDDEPADQSGTELLDVISWDNHDEVKKEFELMPHNFPLIKVDICELIYVPTCKSVSIGEFRRISRSLISKKLQHPFRL